MGVRNLPIVWIALAGTGLVTRTGAPGADITSVENPDSLGPSRQKVRLWSNRPLGPDSGGVRSR